MSDFIEGIDQDGNTVMIPAELFYDDVLDASPVQSISKKVDKRSTKDKKKEKDGPKFNEWIYNNGQYTPAKNTNIYKKVDPGFYSVMYTSNSGHTLLRENLSTDELYELPNTIISEVTHEIRSFWDKASLFEQSEIVHKRGILLYGGPGCGKTSIINLLSKEVIDKGGIVFHIKSINDLNTFLDLVHVYFRQIEPDTPMVTVIEDIDKLMHQDESGLLNFLDGDDQIEHNIVIATTNRIDDLNDLLLRPSRFDWLIEVPSPNDEIRKFFLQKKGLTDETELEKWVKATDNMSMAQLKELYIAVRLLDNDFDAVIGKLKRQDGQVAITTYKPKSKPVGFR